MEHKTGTEITSDNPPEPSENKRKPKTPKHYLDRIPVAGLYNFLHADSRIEKFSWALILLVATGLTLYSVIPIISQFVEFRTVVNVNDINGPTKMAFPPFYVCVGGALNRTYISNEINTIVPKIEHDPRIIHWAEKLKLNVNDLVDRMVYYATYFPTSETWLNPDMLPALNELIYRGISSMGDQWKGMKDFYENGRLHCRNVLSNCQFDGREIPCCEDGLENGWGGATSAFYKIDAENASTKMKATTRHTELSRLSFQIAIDDREILDHKWNMTDVAIHFSPSLPSIFEANILHIPVGHSAHIKVHTRKRILLHDCISQYRLDPFKHRKAHPLLLQFFNEMTAPGQYHLSKCMTAVLLEELYIGCGCVPYLDTITPNDSVICTPHHIFICIQGGFQGDEQVTTANSNRPVAATEVFRSSKSRYQECLPSCETWYYDAQLTVAPLMGERGKDRPIQSYLVIIDLEPVFQEETDALKLDRMAFLGSMGVALGWLLGMSAITFVQASVWAIVAAVVARRIRSVGPEDPTGPV